MNPKWLEQMRTKSAVMLDGDDANAVAVWPEPCEICGANWKLTPAGRFHITHFGDVHARSVPVGYHAPDSRDADVEPPKRAGEAEGVLDILKRLVREPGE